MFVTAVVLLSVFIQGSLQWQNSYDGPLDVQCAENSGFNRVASQHANSAEDRLWQWDCTVVSEVDFSECYWTGYVNSFDQPIYTQCETDYIMSGVSSYHDNGAEDRRWDIRCCKAPNHFTRNCKISEYANTYDGAMDYSVSEPRVFTGMFSAHHDGAEDRIWAFQSCEYVHCTGGLSCVNADNACEQVTGMSGTNLVCSCYEGYSLASNLRSCTDIDECVINNNGGCSHICINSPGSYHCFCEEGYSLDDDKLTCIDIDECQYETHPCQHNCTNTEGSYKCECDDGYYLANNNASCIDIDECDWNNGNCSQICNNIEGSYDCSCRAGYWLSDDEMTCYDIDECQMNNGACEHLCVNTAGSYICYCNEGYQLTNIYCTDIDECKENNGECSNVCINTIGSYICECDDGYMLDNNNHTCIDIDECSINNGTCQHDCTNLEGTFICSCNTGYVIDRNMFCSVATPERSSNFIDDELGLIIVIPVAVAVCIILVLLVIIITVVIMKKKLKKDGKAMINYEHNGMYGLYPKGNNSTKRYDHPDSVSMTSLKREDETDATYEEVRKNY